MVYVPPLCQILLAENFHNFTLNANRRSSTPIYKLITAHPNIFTSNTTNMTKHRYFDIRFDNQFCYCQKNSSQVWMISVCSYIGQVEISYIPLRFTWHTSVALSSVPSHMAILSVDDTCPEGVVHNPGQALPVVSTVDCNHSVLHRFRLPFSSIHWLLCVRKFSKPRYTVNCK